MPRKWTPPEELRPAILGTLQDAGGELDVVPGGAHGHGQGGAGDADLQRLLRGQGVHDTARRLAAPDAPDRPADGDASHAGRVSRARRTARHQSPTRVRLPRPGGVALVVEQPAGVVAAPP